MAEFIVDMANPREKSMVLDKVRGLNKGFHRIEIVAYRARRSDRQNRYYWPCFVQPFGDYLREAKPQFTDEMAHEVLKRMFLEVSECDHRTGVVYSYVRSSADLSTVEFNEYLDKVAAMLATDCGFSVADPAVYHEREAA